MFKFFDNDIIKYSKVDSHWVYDLFESIRLISIPDLFKFGLF